MDGAAAAAQTWLAQGLQPIMALDWWWKGPLVFLLVQLLVFLIFFYLSPIQTPSGSEASSSGAAFGYLWPGFDEDSSAAASPSPWGYTNAILTRLSSFSSSSPRQRNMNPGLSPTVISQLRNWLQRSAKPAATSPASSRS